MKSFLREVAIDLIARFGSELNEVAIIFNNKRPVSFLKKHLGELQGKSSWSPSFFTMPEFLQEGSNLQTADPLKQFFVLHKEYNLLLQQEGLPTLGVEQFYPMAEIILGDFSQIDYDLINPDELFTAMEDISLIQQQFGHFTEKQQQYLEQFWASFSKRNKESYQQKFIDMWKRMPALYHGFYKELLNESLVTTARLYRSEVLKGVGSQLEAKHKKLIFIGFNALNKAEEYLFKQWQAAGKALFYFDVDTYYLDDELQEAGLFIRRSIKTLGLQNALGDALNKIGLKKEQITIIETQGHAAQAKALSIFLDTHAGVLQSENPEQIAIILADESLLLPVLQTIPKTAGIVNVTMGYPFAQSTVFGFIDLWLNIQEQVQKNNKDTVYYRDVQAFLSHPLSLVKQREKDLLQDQLLKQQWLEVPLTQLHFASLLSPNFFTVKHDGLQSVDALYLLLTAMLEQRQKQGDLQQLEANLIMEVCRKLNLLYDGLHNYAPHSPLLFVFSLVRKALQGLSVPLEGEPLRGIQVMGLLESRCLDFEKVIILGVNEGVLPKLSATPSFIPDSLRRTYGLPVLENQDAIFAYFFYRLLQRSSSVSLVYNTLNEETKSNEPSRFLRQLEFESNFNFVYQHQQQTVQVEQVNELVVAKTGNVWRALEAFFSTRGRWDDPKISATALTTYLNCQVQFFFRYIAKIKEPEEVTEAIEANMIGSVLHQVLEWFYEALVKEGGEITAERIRSQVGLMPEWCRQALSYQLYNKDKSRLRHPNSMQQIILRIVEAYVYTILEHDQEVAPFRIVELENKNAYKLPFDIAVNGKLQQVLLYGIIDRVDEQAGKTRIVDYKTGSRDEMGFSTLEQLFERDGNKANKAMVQTLFYTYVYEQVTKRNAVEPHLYIVRKMKSEGTLFSSGTGSGKIILRDQALENVKVDFQVALKTLLEEIFNREIPFSHTKKLENCSYCPYREICQV
ncbi:MAG: PD-(D/E)XK nuclease family protein [Sphingobacteriaceae bacterium]